MNTRAVRGVLLVAVDVEAANFNHLPDELELKHELVQQGTSSSQLTNYRSLLRPANSRVNLSATQASDELARLGDVA